MTNAWVKRTTLEDPLATTVKLVPLGREHARELYEAADIGLFTHTSQAPRELSVAGFEADIDWVNELPGCVAFAIVVRTGPDAGRCIGRTTFMDIKPEHRGLEVGRTWFAKRHHGTRVNPEAKYLMLKHAFEGLSPPAIRVQITTSGTNLHSQAAIAKLGAVREGVLRDARIFPVGVGREQPQVKDWVFYSILAREWPGVKERLEMRLRPV